MNQYPAEFHIIHLPFNISLTSFILEHSLYIFFHNIDFLLGLNLSSYKTTLSLVLIIFILPSFYLAFNLCIFHNESEVWRLDLPWNEHVFWQETSLVMLYLLGRGPDVPHLCKPQFSLFCKWWLTRFLIVKSFISLFPINKQSVGWFMSPSDYNVLQQLFAEWFYYSLMFHAQSIITLVVQAEIEFSSLAFILPLFPGFLYKEELLVPLFLSLPLSPFWDSCWTTMSQRAPTQNLASALAAGSRRRNADAWR